MNGVCRLELLVGNLEQKIGYTTCAEPLRVIDRVVVFGSQGQKAYTACSLLRASPPFGYRAIPSQVLHSMAASSPASPVIPCYPCHGLSATAAEITRCHYRRARAQQLG